jgi:hypothetical protein
MAQVGYAVYPHRLGTSQTPMCGPQDVRLGHPKSLITFRGRQDQ